MARAYHRNVKRHPELPPGWFSTPAGSGNLALILHSVNAGYVVLPQSLGRWRLRRKPDTLGKRRSTCDASHRRRSSAPAGALSPVIATRPDPPPCCCV